MSHTNPTRTDLANAVRFLAIDAVQAANSGHPGMPMGMADIAEVLWRKYLKHDPAVPDWVNRDRFVLSNGHGSMLLYAVLHLSGYGLSIDDLKGFRKWQSITPGHPERGLTPGVETTTGPLGQGLANAVGMALAERLLAAEFNEPGFDIVDHHTYVFLGDGCLMEGVSHEVCSLAGTWHLGKLIAFYDDNGISIDGHVEGWFTDQTPMRFRAYGWHVVEGVDGHDPLSIEQAIEAGRAERDRPTLICCKTVIGHGSPNRAGTHDVHGAPLGAAEIAATREHLGWRHAPFDVPESIRDAWDARAAGRESNIAWRTLFEAYRTHFPEKAGYFESRMHGSRRERVSDVIETLLEGSDWFEQKMATRKASQRCLEQLVGGLPELLGGSADLAPSNLTIVPASRAVMPGSTNGPGNYIHYGVREFGMVAIMNGVALHGGFLPYGGTFLVFSDYAKNALRMAALMHLQCIYVFTHDSIGLGEDGPTHQPVEHAAMLRQIPGMSVWRPADAVETAFAWAAALETTDAPTALLLSRQNLPPLSRSARAKAHIRQGGYVLSEATGGKPDIVLIATGSEVELALKAQTALAEQGIAARVVSMPSTTTFDGQPLAYRLSVLPPKIRRVAIEAAAGDFWRKYVGLSGAVIGLSHFGESAPAETLYEKFGITVDAIVDAVGRTLEMEPGIVD
ncbi:MULTISPECIES: transketolase [Paraburkholderia]|uniref:transketolase n=1 Tax=Paraburkholderia TaxID=1822464 RepID=UPI001B2270D4|nr:MULTISPECIES: transketolase [Paraburkholderia]MCX4159190.1 transketolase [Paraburkholderia aspalathi]MDN7168589.1 transketolase [Paraburkholderia sp. SECH2]MDQ6397076.1 transketolase [Paraburkholderia aspalathi]CAE6786416.1 Transketolase 1 [Paraburkholderia aspalathi]